MPTYSYTTLDDPEATPVLSNSVPVTMPGGVNDAGQITGYFSNDNDSVHRFLYSGGNYTSLGDPLPTHITGIFTYETGINNAGQIVEFFGDGNGSPSHSFLYSGGSYTMLAEDPQRPSTVASGINDAGQIVGTLYYVGHHGYLYSGGTFTTFGVPTTGGTYGGTYATDINNVGQIVGSYSDGYGDHGFLYSGGSYTTLDDPEGLGPYITITVASGINDVGQIVGSYSDGGGVHGFLYSGGTYTTIDDPSAWIGPSGSGTWVTGINNAGQIVGYYQDSGGVHGFLATPLTVQEPTGSDPEITFISGITSNATVAATSFDTWNGGWNGTGNADNPATYNAQSFSTKWGSTTLSTSGTPGGNVTYWFDAGSNWSNAEKNALISGLGLWSAEANITFSLAENAASADFTFIRGATDSGANTQFVASSTIGSGTEGAPVDGSSISIDTSQPEFAIGGSFAQYGGYPYETLVHEEGHMLGLGHAGPYNGGVGFDPSTQQFSAYDSRLWTIMSYIDPADQTAKFYSSYPVGGTSWGTSSDGQPYQPTTPMILDILAAQRIYGTPTSGALASGGQTFGFNCNVSGPAEQYFDFTINTHPVITIWDGGTNNTLDLSGFSANATISLTPGTFTSCDGMVHNIGIADGTIIQTAIGGSGNDLIIPDAGVTSTLTGGAGNDTFEGTQAGLTADTITDMNVGDKINFTDSSLGSFTYTRDGTTLTYGASFQITLSNNPSGRFVLTDDPVYGGIDLTLEATVNPTVINNVSDLQAIQNNPSGYYVLGADIDAAGFNFTPIGSASNPFTGIFDGQGYTISNLTINTLSDAAGLFGVIGATGMVRNVGLTNESVTSHSYVGGLVGENFGTVSQSYAGGNVSGISQVGGLAGFNAPSGSITQSFATATAGTIGGGVQIGGLVGSNQGTVIQSYATGTTNPAFTLGLVIGGLAGLNGGTITQSYSIGLVGAGGGFGLGGLVGAANAGGTVTASYWDTQTSGRSTSAGGTGLTTAQLESGVLPDGFDPTIWLATAGQFPELSWQMTNPQNDVTWSIQFHDPDGTYALHYPDIERVLLAAGEKWSSCLSGNCQIEVEVRFDPELSGAASTEFGSIVDQLTGNSPVAYEIETGIDPNGAVPDIILTINPKMLVPGANDSFWFDPNPDASSGSVPVNQRDALGTFEHELAHALGISGYVKYAQQNLTSPFDRYINKDYYFTGPSAEAVYGGPVPLWFATSGYQGSNIYHLNIPTDTMYFTRQDGVRKDISALDLAILKDCGLPITGAVANPVGVTITGTSSNDTIDGKSTVAGQSLPTSNNDIITGGAGNDSISALDGDDLINGGPGKDRMIGGRGNDTYVVDNTGDVVIENVGDGLDTVRSSISYVLPSNVDILGLTGIGNLNCTGNALDNVITGNVGKNGMAGLGGRDVLDGGGGIDTATYAASGSGVNVSLMTGLGSGGDAEGDTLVNIENLTGSTFDDVVEGNAGANVLVGGANGMAGDTVSYANATAGVRVNLATASAQNTVGAGTDTLSGFENVIGSAFGDTLTGTAVANVLTGGGGNDTLNGGGDADSLFGGIGNDVLIGGAGGDTLDGGDGIDTASYAGSAQGVTVDLTLAGAQAGAGDAKGDVLISIENLIGSALADRLTGDVNDNVLIGGAGNDILAAGGGNGAAGDTASYATATAGVTVSLLLQGGGQNTVGAGTDTLSEFENLIGSAFNDRLTGDAGNNVLTGGAGNDTLVGGLGEDTLDGGAGTGDTASYATATAGVTVSLLLQGGGQNTVGAGTDTLSEFENLIGSAFNDRLTGDSLANRIDGGAGDDTIEGGAGNDVLLGGLNGAAGDTVSYEHAGTGVRVNLATASAQNTVGAGTDTLSGFENVIGSAFGDTLTGTAVANVLTGGGGNDTLNGGGGADTFVFKPGFGNDTIKDFTVAGANHDLIELDHSMFAQFNTAQDLLNSTQIAQVGSSVVITQDANDTITLNNVSLATLRAHADDFHFDDIAFGSNTTLGYAGNSSGPGGTLMVSDGTAANIALLGQYMAASFVPSADGFGGTLIHELPPATLTQTLTQPQHS